MRTLLRIAVTGLLFGGATAALVAVTVAPVLPADSPEASRPEASRPTAALREAAPLPDHALVSIEEPAAGTAATLLAEGVMVVRDLERYLLAAATGPDRARMTALGLDWRMLDESIGEKAYYTVLLRRAARVAEVRRAVRVLRADEWDAVIEAPPAAAERLAGLGFEIARVFLRPIRPARIDRAALPVRPRAITPDPVIQSIVADVSSAEIDGHVQRLQDFVTRYCAHDSCYAAALYIKSEFEAAGIDSVYLQDWHPTYHENVVAVIPGKGLPEKTVVIGGHYDSYTGNQNNAPGADDDASGTSCVMECARVLAGHDFTYTIKFVAFCAEELGLYGSEAFAAAAYAAGEDIVAAICVDMIGYVAGGDAVDLDIIDNGASVWIRDLVMDVGATYVPGFSIVDGAIPGGASSDHASFWAYGYDAILFFEDSDQYSPYIHTTSDVVGTSYNNPVLAERSVKTAAALVATIATPFTVAIAHTPLENTEDTLNPYRVVADIVTATTLDPDSLLVRYTTGGPVQEASLTPSAPPDEYEGWIPAQAGGTWVDYWLVAADTQGNRVTHPENAPAETHSFFVGTITTVFADDMEASTGWTVGDVGDNATTGIWVRVDPNGTWSGSVPVQPEDDHTPAPGTMAWITGQSPPGAGQGDNDVDGGKTTVMSPVYDLSGYLSVRVRYHRWYTNDTGAAPGTDEWVVDVSSNGGASWVRLETLSASDRSWGLVEADVGALVDLTSQVKFRFIARDDAPGSIVEAGVDDLSFVIYQSPATGLTELPLVTDRLLLAQNIPNPFGPKTDIRFAVPAPGREVTLRVFDVSGRLVARLLDRELVEGRRSVTWDGRDATGERVSAGVYFYRLEAGEERLSRKLVLLR